MELAGQARGRKMHLVVRVPNDGAHRLAWWLGEQPEADGFEELSRATALSFEMIDRMLFGEVVPEWWERCVIARVTGHAVRPMDWSTDAIKGWFDRPEPHAEPAPAWVGRTAKVAA